MASRIHAAGIGRKYLLSRLRVSVVGGGLTRHRGEVLVNPADYEAALSLFRPSVLDRALSSSGDALLLGSVASSAFQGITLLGLLGGRRVAGTSSELLDRAFPDLPSQVLYLADRVRDEVDRNERLVSLLRQRAGPGSGVGVARSGFFGWLVSGFRSFWSDSTESESSPSED